MNARERLAAVAEWLGWQDEDMSAGLRNAFDGLRLYDYAQAHPDIGEMADEWEMSHRVAALGYDPLYGHGEYFEAPTTGADAAADAMRNAYTLIDSVAFVRDKGDSVPILAALAASVGM